ncbi:hypothetical protein GGS26DRAFT_592216 [Hypomontagnella submonticulosa]|nr:hypothetical protein GGS26DRAFT_592216 [Hypomontagnella submonticulosa]
MARLRQKSPDPMKAVRWHLDRQRDLGDDYFHQMCQGYDENTATAEIPHADATKSFIKVPDDRGPDYIEMPQRPGRIHAPYISYEIDMFHEIKGIRDGFNTIATVLGEQNTLLKAMRRAIDSMDSTVSRAGRNALDRCAANDSSYRGSTSSEQAGMTSSGTGDGNPSRCEIGNTSSDGQAPGLPPRIKQRHVYSRRGVLRHNEADFMRGQLKARKSKEPSESLIWILARPFVAVAVATVVFFLLFPVATFFVIMEAASRRNGGKALPLSQGCVRDYV